MIALVVFLGLINWFATTIITEGEIMHPVRDAVDRWANPPRAMPLDLHDVVERYIRATLLAKMGENPFPQEHPWRAKLAYLIHCQMCCGTWVGLILAATFGSPLPGLPGIVAGGLLYKAIGHLVLELRPQAWYRRGV